MSFDQDRLSESSRKKVSNIPKLLKAIIISIFTHIKIGLTDMSITVLEFLELFTTFKTKTW